MPERDNSLLLNDILTCIERIEEYTLNLSFNEFLNRNIVQDAVLRNFTVIGEAISRLTPDFKQKYPYQWQMIKDFRNKIIHDYSGIDWTLVWSIIKEHIPKFREYVITVQSDLTTNL